MINVRSRAWAEGMPGSPVEGDFGRLQLTKHQGMRALITPTWALDTGFEYPLWTRSNELELAQAMRTHKVRIAILDLPAGTEISEEAQFMGHGQHRHTRIASLNVPLPSHRLKQVRKALRMGFQFEDGSKDIDQMVKFHQSARNRKGIPSDSKQLHQLLSALSEHEGVQHHFVRNAIGQRIAGGVFIRTKEDTLLYAFGGAPRSAESGLASVLLLTEAMNKARNSGIAHFDFGGSQDPGVDRFYAEFGAEVVTKWRWVLVSTGWKWFWKWRRPDLFSGPK